MKFTFQSYGDLINKIQKNGYNFSDYENWKDTDNDKTVIMRHDVDLDLHKAALFSEFEASRGVSTTYFLLLTSDFYNVFSYESCSEIKRILRNGHDVGLHYDEKRYLEDYGNIEMTIAHIIKECEMMSQIIEKRVSVVSMHRPSKNILESDIRIPGIINSYGKIYFQDFKYVSDSRRNWRENIDDVISCGKYNHLHILTHAFWYNEKGKNLHDSIKDFVNSANQSRYSYLRNNITDLDSIMSEKEISY